MPFAIENFKSGGLRLGGARPNMFDIQLTFPSFITSPVAQGGGGNGTNQQISLLCKAASAPPMIQDDIQVPYFGRMSKWAGDRQYPDWEITILNDEDFALRDAFETWSAKMNDPMLNTMSSDAFPVSYKIDAGVTQYGKSGNTIRQYTFHGMWPKVVDPMPLDWGQQNTIQEFNITLAYDMWVKGTGAASGTSGY